MRKSVHTNDGRRGPCVHVLNGRVEGPKTCIFNHECYHCAFDQWLDHMEAAGNAQPASTGTPMDLTARCVQAA